MKKENDDKNNSVTWMIILAVMLVIVALSISFTIFQLFFKDSGNIIAPGPHPVPPIAGPPHHPEPLIEPRS